ncbi:MAG: glycoside hydrolase family 97 protein [candidate division KSB1 bacterium]|nr:glycoside hydrolase family 97 protein [candidate division KSB1 bacterium]
MKRSALTLIISAALLSCSARQTQDWQVVSPDGRIALTVSLNRSDGSLSYTVASGGVIVIESSPLGLVRTDASFAAGLSFISRSDRVIDETYTLHNGKRSLCRNFANEATLTFANAQGGKIEMIARAYNDGAAFKYRFPETDSEVKTLEREVTAFKIQAGKAFIMPYDNPSQYTPAYENYYAEYPVGTASPTEAGWAMPALFNVNNGKTWLLIAESGLNGSYCGTRFEKEAPGGLYRIRFPEAKDGEGVGDVRPSSTLPWETSWKAMIIADSPAGIVESSLITHLADPPAYPVDSYIKPGRAGWSWWSESNSPRDFKRQRKFIDYCAQQDWEYYLVDANWNFEPTADLISFIKYAQSKNVGVWLWYNSGGPHNIVTEAPRERMYDIVTRRRELQWLKEIGVKGVKVDFWHSDKQGMIQYYIDLLKDANDYGIMVNFHGCTVPRGWERTYPNMMTLEAVRGAECYKFAPEYPEKAPLHNVHLVFTRNAIGPMDYTPVTFSDVDYPHLTTNAHELALSVVFQSGVLHFADKPESYAAQPDEVQSFLKTLPVVWDETLMLDGHPSSHVVLARKKGEVWYVGGINGLKEPKTVTLDLSKLFNGEKIIQFIGDGDSPRTFAFRSLAGDAQQIVMQPYGGFVMTVAPKQ